MAEIKCPCGVRNHMEEEDCKKTNCNACCPLTKSQTNADRIRAMSDHELAVFMAERYAAESIYRVREQGHEPTATQIKALNEGLYCAWMRWLRQQVEVDNGQA